jgi:hypothetical protein
MSVTAMKAKSTVESLRDIVQDLLVPDMKALKVGLETHRVETKLQTDVVRSEVVSLRNEMNISLDSLRIEIRLRDEKQSQAIHAFSDKQAHATQALSDRMDQAHQTLSDKMEKANQALLDRMDQANKALTDKMVFTADVRERLAVLEDREKRPS